MNPNGNMNNEVLYESPNDPMHVLCPGNPSIVKIAHTSQSSLNGQYALVHGYDGTRDRYAVRVLGDGTNDGRMHPALLFFGGACDEEEFANSKAQKDDCSIIYLPPCTIGPLTTLDVVTLYLQYLAVAKLSSPGLASLLHTFKERMQQLGSLTLFSSQGWIVTVIAIVPLLFSLLVQWYTSSSPSAPNEEESMHPSILSSMPSITSLLSFHTSDILILLAFLLGTNIIVRFLLREYTQVKQKADSITATNTNTNTTNHNHHNQKQFTTSEMIEYRIDYYFSTSKWSKVLFLLSLTFILIVIGATLLSVVSQDHSLSNAAWLSWTYVADPGTHADAPEGILVRTISFSITLGGMIIFALMIGIISDSIGEKVDELKKGKSRIVESQHSIVLGWNDKSLAIVQQIALANESEGGGTIVILAEEDKEELEELLHSAVMSKENPLRLLGTEVIIRSGNPLLESELRKISLSSARSVIALSKTQEDMDPDEADANQVRQVMALKTFEGFEGGCHVVVELQDLDNQELCSLVAPNFAEVIVTNDLIGRLMLQCARCPGLAAVLEVSLPSSSQFSFTLSY